MKERGTIFLAVLMLVQIGCSAFFMLDVIAEWPVLGQVLDPNLVVEAVASAVLLAGTVAEWKFLTMLLQRQARAERALNVAAGELHELIEKYFHDWGLTPSEADVAMFALKGYSIPEIAGFRGSREGTIKSHLNGIYRKAGVGGRAQLLSLLMEDLMAAPLGEGERAAG